MFKVSILWGRSLEEGQRPVTYKFGTEAELDAFREGVEAAVGWSEHREVAEDFVYTEEEPD